MKEYDRADATFYDYYATGLEGDVQFYVEEAQKASSPVLELACGTGRILIPVAESGISIVGLDRAPAMLSIAREKISKLNVETQRRIKIVEGDMRNLSLDERFKLIMIPYRAFLHLLTPEDQRQALCCIREHLTDDGLLIFNIFDPRLDIIAAHFGSLGSAIKKSQEFIHPDTGHRVVVWDSRQYDLERQIIEQYFIFEELDDGGRVISKTYSPMTLRYVYRYEMQYLLELCGYRIEALYGDFQRGPFRYGNEQIWIARRN
ncbi:MAG: class I SAM-dependent methyltransferase [Deltaproteobacteria bacterium]|nr:class I SAM-dependent methyltransferase [Deltaproteobacteria bacterium]